VGQKKQMLNNKTSKRREDGERKVLKKRKTERKSGVKGKGGRRGHTWRGGEAPQRETVGREVQPRRDPTGSPSFEKREKGDVIT